MRERKDEQCYNLSSSIFPLFLKNTKWHDLIEYGGNDINSYLPRDICIIRVNLLVFETMNNESNKQKLPC